MSIYPDLWGGGQLLAFSGIDGQTDFKNGLVLRTAMHGYAFEFKNSLSDSPDAKIIYTGPAPERIELTGDFFRFYAGNQVSTGIIADASNILLEGEFKLELTPEYESARTETRMVAALKNFLCKEWLSADLEQLLDARTLFLRNVPIPPEVSENSKRTARKAWSQLKTQIYAPEGQIRSRWSTPDRWPHKNMWLWDSVFHALGMRHYDPKLAREMISAMFDLQRADGLIPHSGNPVSFHNSTQPPVLSLAIKMIDAVDPDPEWIAELAPKLERYIEWIMANRDSDGNGLVEWEIEANENCRSGESGMDNSPRFDGAIQLDAPDFNAFLAYECESLAQFLPEKRDYWTAHYDRLCKAIRERLWSEECGMFVDYDVKGNCRTDIMSSAGFLPLYCGAATPQQAAKLAQHLTNPETFGTPLRVPSIAKSNTAAYRKDMWRGPVWININYLIALGLERYGYHELASSIIQDTLRELEKWYLECGTFFEFYDDRKELEPRALERKGKMPEVYNPYHQAFHDYGWSATLYLEMLFHAEWR